VISDNQYCRGVRAALARLAASPGLLRLTTIRLAGQFGDGMFQAALAGAILFDPTKRTDPLDIAAGFTVLLLPYSVVGPYAGALLDRWDRRTVLLLANLLRTVLITATSIGLFAGMGVHPLLVLALATVGVSRFLLSGISAALPHVVPADLLIPTNSLLATLSAGIAGLGAGCAGVVMSLGGGHIGTVDSTGAAIAVAASAAGSVVSMVAAAGFRRGRLGPNGAEMAAAGAEWRRVAGGLRTGALAVWRTPSVTAVMTGIAAHRLVFGIDTLIMVLVLRTPNHGSGVLGGIVGFGVSVAAVAAGMFVAAVVTPLLTARLGRTRTVSTGLVFALAVQAGVVATLAQPLLVVGAFLLGLAGQTIKLTGDAAMQLDLDDDRRGHVFALQDTVFNIGFVLAIGIASLVAPDDGRSRPLVLGGAGIYLLGLVCVLLNSTRIAPSAARQVTATNTDTVGKDHQ
jgi:MFS family permease